MVMTNKTDVFEVFKRNGIISADGQIAGVLNPPAASCLPALQAELTPLLKEAERRRVMLRLGVLQGSDEDDHGPVLVYAIDVGGPHDTHHFLRRFLTILVHHDVQPLDFDMDFHAVFDLADHLVRTSRI